ncbi:hypothetical protein Rs2_29155 [Raphanus sativus]|nr:hypothetical protein Rs2_29155 [Raphanus sativus]
MAEASESERRADSSSSSSSSPPSRHGKDVQDPLTLAPLSSPEHASSGMPEEIAIYEAFFESGFRDDVMSLIVSLCDYFHIYPSQLNPPALRILIAIQNLGYEEGLALRGIFIFVQDLGFP